MGAPLSADGAGQARLVTDIERARDRFAAAHDSIALLELSMAKPSPGEWVGGYE